MSSGSSLFLQHSRGRRARANQSHVRFIEYLQEVGFHKEKEIAFAHKQAALMKIGRDGWCAPVL